MSQHFIPVSKTTTSLNLRFFFFFSPRRSYCVAREASLLSGHRGKRADRPARHKSFFVFVIRVIFLSGVAAHQAEIMRPCFMISDRTL